MGNRVGYWNAYIPIVFAVSICATFILEDPLLGGLPPQTVLSPVYRPVCTRTHDLSLSAESCIDTTELQSTGPRL